MPHRLVWRPIVSATLERPIVLVHQHGLACDTVCRIAAAEVIEIDRAGLMTRMISPARNKACGYGELRLSQFRTIYSCGQVCWPYSRRRQRATDDVRDHKSSSSISPATASTTFPSCVTGT